MKLKDLSLKEKFTAAVIGVFGAPRNIRSVILVAEGYVARLRFVDADKNGKYSGTVEMFEKDGAPYLWGAGQLYKAVSALPHGADVPLNDVPRRIEQWQDVMKAQGWTNESAPDIGGGATYRAVAYKSGIVL
jgi:hypothetical protein